MLIKVIFFISIILLFNTWGAKTSSAESLNAKNSNTLSLFFNNLEGGDTSKRRIENFRLYLIDEGCPVDTISLPTVGGDDNGELNNTSTESNNITRELVFTSLARDFEEKTVLSEYRKQLDIKVINNQPVASSILVRTATAIHSLESLDNVWFAFSNNNSTLSYKAAWELLQLKGVSISPSKIMFSYSDIASLTLIMHKDVFATAIASPLASKWASANGLTVVAETQAFELGGLWIKSSVDKTLATNCSNALQNLYDTTETDFVTDGTENSLANQTKTSKVKSSKIKSTRQLLSIRKIFPAWFSGFKQP